MFSRQFLKFHQKCRNLHFMSQSAHSNNYSISSSINICTNCKRNKENRTENAFSAPRRKFSTEEFKNSYNNLFKNVTESDAVSAVKDGLVAVHDVTGLPWAGTIMLTTVAIRTLVTFPLGVYQQIILARLELVKIEFKDIIDELKKETALAIRKFEWTEQQAKIVYKASLKTQWQKLIERENCHPLKSVLVVFIQLPAWIMLSLALRSMSYGYGADHASKVQIPGQLNHEGFAWFPNLLVPDPTGILPISVSLINLAIIELQASTRATHTRPQKIITNIFRGVALLSLPIALTVPSSMSLYWALSSGLALTQNVLLMSPRVRRLCHIPVTATQQQHPYANAWTNFKSKWSWIRIILIRNPFTSLGQRYWIARCLRDFPRKPNKRNVDIDLAACSIDNLWTEYQDFSKSLRWVTLGYHHNWDTKVYTEDSRGTFPSDLSLLCQHIAETVGYSEYHPQAAIVNFYHPGSTLSGHVDNSELDMDAPLISISFGQSAIFLIGGTTSEEEPTPLLLQSGDILIMRKEARLCYHAVPRIVSTTKMPWQETATETTILEQCESDLVEKLDEERFWEPFGCYVKTNRINVNVRQVFGSNNKFEIQGSL